MTENDRPASSALRVRPYLLTGGRTRSAVDLPLEAQVSATDEAAAAVNRQKPRAPSDHPALR